MASTETMCTVEETAIYLIMDLRAARRFEE